MNNSTAESDVLASWSERIAAQVASDEIDLVPDVLTAYIAGGAARRQLFSGPRADPGAFGAGLPLVMPYVIDALVHCYTVVRGLLGDPAVNSAIAIASLAVALRQSWKAESVRDGSATGTPAQPPQAADVPAADSEVAVRAADTVAALAARLAATPVIAGRAEAVAGEVLTVLATDPGGATRFLDVIAKSGT
ncbi:MAG TPA: hypothetical protein VIY28_14750 [Pseudonocardiaceae bacterium]